MSRLTRESPYHADHAGSLARRASPPRDLLGWFMEGFRAELPDHQHTAGVWRDRKRRGDLDGYQPVGGSLLGSPRDATPFQMFIEDGPFTTETAELEGHKDPVAHYVYPMRAAMATLAGRGRATDDYPFLVRTLYRTALRDGDWDTACASLGIIEPVRRVYIQVALERLWARFSIEPPARSLRESTAA